MTQLSQESVVVQMQQVDYGITAKGTRDVEGHMQCQRAAELPMVHDTEAQVIIKQ